MAWVRRVRTASGATAVQIAEYVDGRRRIVAHVGSAHTEAELGLLLEQARGLLHDAGQDELDLGVRPSPRQAPLVAPFPRAAALFTDPARSRRLADRPRVAAPEVIGTYRSCCSTRSPGSTRPLGSESWTTRRFVTW